MKKYRYKLRQDLLTFTKKIFKGKTSFSYAHWNPSNISKPPEEDLSEF